MSHNTDAARVASHADRCIRLDGAQLAEEYFYQSLPLCIIDAVYSMGVKYTAVQNVVRRYCNHFDLKKIRSLRDSLPATSEQESIAEFCEKYSAHSPREFAEDIYCNKQRTSSTSGILKAEAVLHWAEVLRDHSVEYLQDVPSVMGSTGFECAMRAVRGQSSGISLSYFWMLSGSDDLIKPDRMIIRFLKDALGREPALSEAQGLVAAACETLKDTYPELTPRLLDYEVWQYQREVD